MPFSLSNIYERRIARTLLELNQSFLKWTKAIKNTRAATSRHHQINHHGSRPEQAPLSFGLVHALPLRFLHVKLLRILVMQWCIILPPLIINLKFSGKKLVDDDERVQVRCGLDEQTANDKHYHRLEYFFDIFGVLLDLDARVSLLDPNLADHNFGGSYHEPALGENCSGVK